MDISGHWLASISTPMGPVEMVLDLHQDAAAVTGTCEARGEKLDLYDGSISGETATFKMDIASPMKMTFSATVTVSGDTMTGKAKPGAFPGAKMTATRQH